MLCAKLRNLETLIAPIVPSNTRRITIETKTTTLARYGMNNEPDRLFKCRTLPLSKRLSFGKKERVFQKCEDAMRKAHMCNDRFYAKCIPSASFSPKRSLL